jgi:hypothetical protein
MTTTSPTSTASRVAAAAGTAPNHIYYFQIAKGSWAGQFGFTITDPQKLRDAKLGLRNRFLIWCLSTYVRIFGAPPIDSHIEAFPDKGAFGVATNVIRIHGILNMTLFLSHEEYVLNPDGVHVIVKAHERYGPVPFLFREDVEYPAAIHPDGLSSTYEQPALGEVWQSNYTVQDHDHVSSVLRCVWGEASETIHRLIA